MYINHTNAYTKGRNYEQMSLVIVVHVSLNVLGCSQCGIGNKQVRGIWHRIMSEI